MLSSKFSKALSISLFCAAFSAPAAEPQYTSKESSGGCAAPAAEAAPPATSAIDLPSYDAAAEAAARDPAEKAFESAWIRYQHDVVATLAASSDPRDLSTAALVTAADFWQHDSSAVGTAALSRAVAAAPDDVLVQWIAVRMGRTREFPLGETALQRLQHLDPQNGAIWLETLNSASQRKDAASVDLALSRLATSSRFDLRVADMTKLVIDAFDRVPSADFNAAFQQMSEAHHANVNDVAGVLAFSVNAIVSMPAYQDVVRECRKSDTSSARSADCAAAGHLMATQGDTQLTNRVGYTLLRVAQTYTPDDERAARLDDWITAQHVKAVTATGDSPNYLLDFQRAWIAAGSERSAMRAAVEQANLPLTPPEDWVDEMSPFSTERMQKDALAAQHDAGVK